MSTIDEDLGQIERDIRTLKIEYEQYFGGGRPRPPADTRDRSGDPRREAENSCGVRRLRAVPEPCGRWHAGGNA